MTVATQISQLHVAKMFQLISCITTGFSCATTGCCGYCTETIEKQTTTDIKPTVTQNVKEISKIL